LLLLLSVVAAACGDDKGSDSEDEQQTSNTPTQDPSPRARVTVSRAAVYLTPDREAPTILTLVEGDELAITAKTAPDALGAVFYSVQIGEQFGWILSSQVETSGNVAALLVLEDPTSNPNPSDGVTESVDLTPEDINIALIRTLADDTSMYTSPSADSDVLITLVQDVEFSPTYQTPPDDSGLIYYGVEVPFEGRLRLGWLPSTSVEVTGDTSTLVMIVTSTPTPASGDESTAVAQDATPAEPASSIPTTNTALPEISPESPTIRPSQEAEIAPTTPTITLEPTITPTPLPSLTPTALVRAIEPPIYIDVPATWDSGHFVVPTESSIPGGDTEITISKYEGPLNDGSNGYIWVFSGFSNLVPQGARFDLYPDANLILRSLLFPGCNIGLDVEERTIYQIGPHQSIGARYVAIGCDDEEPDIGGWFAALPVNGNNYVFFIGIDPPDHELENTAYFQSLLNTVQFLD
jgi:hypothetical protein